MVVQMLSGITLTVKWHWIGNRLVEWLSIGNQVTWVVVQWLSCSTLAVNWHWIENRLVEWLYIGIQVTWVVVQWLSCCTIAVKWHWIKTRLVKWKLLFNGWVVVHYHSSGTGLERDWLSGYPLVIRQPDWLSSSTLAVKWHFIGPMAEW